VGELLASSPYGQAGQPSPTASPLLFEFDPEPLPESLTALGGIPLVVWAETGLVLADQFRDGNVAAMMEVLPVGQCAFAALPSTVKQRYFRGDSACHEARLVNWLLDQKRLALPAELLTARPKRLRFPLFNTPGRLVHHARRLVLRLSAPAKWTERINTAGFKTGAAGRGRDFGPACEGNFPRPRRTVRQSL